MNCILKYPGSKWSIADWIISYFPEHKVYCEPFCGSAAVFFRKPKSFIETINDSNSDIINLFCTCREQSEELAALINLTPFSREEFVRCYERSDNKLEQARRTLVRYWQSFGSANRTLNTWKNSQTKSGPNNNKQWNQLPQLIIKVLARLKDAQIENISAFKLIEKYDSVDTLLYLDPPYPTVTRTKYLYQNEMSDDEHVHLLELIKKSKSKVIISSYDNDLYNKALDDWKTAEIKVTAQMGLQRVEKLYMNFSLPYFGFDCNNQ